MYSDGRPIAAANSTEEKTLKAPKQTINQYKKPKKEKPNHRVRTYIELFHLQTI